jgi:hypothetical protein
MKRATNHHPVSPSPKAQSVWLEKNIQEVEQLLAADREAVNQNPESFSARLSLQSTENRLCELRNFPQAYLCAGCGGETAMPTDDPGFGLCGRCESRLNSQGMSWRGAEKKAPLPCGRSWKGKTFSASGLSTKQR